MNPKVVDEAAEMVNADQPLKPRKCPACAKDCIRRKGRAGYFMGCPDFPLCPGRAVTINTDQRRDARKKMKLAFDFIGRMGGPDAAKVWLESASAIVGIYGAKKAKDGAS